MKYYSVTQLAKALGYTRFAIYKMIGRGIIKTDKVEGLGWIIPESDYRKAVMIMKVAKSGTRPFYGMGPGFRRIKQVKKK